MANDVENQLVRYFGWIEKQSGGVLHRDPDQPAVSDVPAASLDDAQQLAALELQFHATGAVPRRNTRRRIVAFATVAVVGLVAGIVIRGTFDDLRARTVELPTPPAAPISQAPPISPTPSLQPPLAPTVVEPIFEVRADSQFAPSSSDFAVFSSDGSTILAAMSGMIIRLGSDDGATATGSPTILGPPEFSRVVQISPDGSRAFALGQLHDTSTGGVTALAEPDVRAGFSPDGLRIVVPTDSPRGEGRATIFDTSTGEPIIVLQSDDFAIAWAIYSPDGSRIMTQGEAGITRIWDATTGEQIIELDDSDSLSSFNPDGTTVLSVGPSGRVRTRSATTGELGAFDHQFDPVGDTRAWFSSDGDTIAIWYRPAAGDGNATIELWSARTGDRLGLIPAVSSGVTLTEASFSADGDRMVTVAPDGSGEIWRIATSAKLATLMPVTEGLLSVAFSPDGHRVVGLGNQGTIRMWEAP